MGRGKSQYSAIVRARVPSNFRDRLQKILRLRGHGDESELLREALLRHIESEESRLGIENTSYYYPSVNEPEPQSRKPARKRKKGK